MKRIMKLISIFMVVTIAMISFTSCGNDNNEPKKSKNGIITIDDGKMRKDMTSKEYAKEMGLGINLGNTLDSHYADYKTKCSGGKVVGDGSIKAYETCWGAVETTQEVIDGMKNEGFNTIRVPVFWGNSMKNDGEFKITDEMFNRVEEIINYCRNNGLYVVINMHHYDQYIVETFSQDEAVEITKKLWTQIAQRYKDYSDYLIFEGFNECLGQSRESDTYSEEEMFKYVNRMNQTFVDAVRNTGGNNKNRLLIVSGYWTNIDLTTKENYEIPKDTVEDRIMVSVHYVDNSIFWEKQIGGQKWLDYSIAQLELLKKAFIDKGYTVFLGEIAAIYPKENFTANPIYTESSACLEKMINMILDYECIPVIWDVNDNFYSRTEFKIKSDSDKAVIDKALERLNKK